MSTLDTEGSWEGNPTGTKESVFEIVIDGASQEVSKDMYADFQDLALNVKHEVVIKLNGKQLASFYFRFEEYNCNHLWMDYKELYGEWMLRTANKRCKNTKPS